MLAEGSEQLWGAAAGGGCASKGLVTARVLKDTEGSDHWSWRRVVLGQDATGRDLPAAPGLAQDQQPAPGLGWDSPAPH